MNAYQKATILITGAWLPLLLLYMKAMRYAGAWMGGGNCTGACYLPRVCTA